MTEQNDEMIVELVYDPSIAEEYRREHPELYPPVPVEIEGDRWSWWYVCGECHGAVGKDDLDCPHCKRGLKWE